MATTTGTRACVGALARGSNNVHGLAGRVWDGAGRGCVWWATGRRAPGREESNKVHGPVGHGTGQHGPLFMCSVRGHQGVGCRTRAMEHATRKHG